MNFINAFYFLLFLSFLAFLFYLCVPGLSDSFKVKKTSFITLISDLGEKYFLERSWGGLCQKKEDWALYRMDAREHHGTKDVKGVCYLPKLVYHACFQCHVISSLFGHKCQVLLTWTLLS